MKNCFKNRKGFIFVLCFTLVVFASSQALAGYKKSGIQPEFLQKVLKLAGTEAEIISLNRSDDIDQAVFFETSTGRVIVIGFPKNGIQNNVPFLLSDINLEALVKRTSNGKIAFISGDEEIVTDGFVDDLVLCILNAVEEMVEGIDDCGLDTICVLEATFDGIIDIVECLI